jgi:hypothetical protein
VSKNDIRIVSPGNYTGEGRSRGLARGLLVFSGELNLAGEGMGIGTVALRDNNDTFFSRSWTDSTEGDIFRRVFSLDTRMGWRLRGKSSPLLARLIRTGVGIYTKVPRLQDRILKPSLRLRALFGIEPFFENIPSRGSVTFTYRVNGHQVEIHVGSEVEAKPQEILCLLNELSAAWFTTGWDGTQQVPPPPGWKEVSQEQLPVYLIDPFHGIRFSIDKPAVNPQVPIRIYQGRENTADLCWAGFCIELGPEYGSQRIPEVRYSVGLVPESRS